MLILSPGQLCSSRATRFPDVLELCEKINDSENQEIVGREAARSIRKVFKNGTDPERRMAARVWLITMLNVSAKDYHRAYLLCYCALMSTRFCD